MKGTWCKLRLKKQQDLEAVTVLIDLSNCKETGTSNQSDGMEVNYKASQTDYTFSDLVSLSQTNDTLALQQ